MSGPCKSSPFCCTFIYSFIIFFHFQTETGMSEEEQKKLAEQYEEYQKKLEQQREE